MSELRCRIPTENWLHARPAARLARVASAFCCGIQVEYAGRTADARDILAVMDLPLRRADMLTFAFQGEDEDEALSAVQKLISNL